MKATVSRDILLQSLRVVTQVSSRFSFADSLLLAVEDVDGGPRLRLTKTDLSTTFHCWTSRIWDEEPGQVAVAKELAAWVSLADYEPLITMSVREKEGLEVRCGRGKALFRDRADAWVTEMRVHPVDGLSLPGMRSVRRVSFAAAKDMGRPILTGVLVRSNKERAILAAADGYRLAEACIPGEFPEMQFVAFGLDRWARTLSILDITDDQSRVTVLDNKVVFQVDTENLSVQMVVDQLAGQYPNYEHLQLNCRVIASVSVRDLKRAIRTARTMVKSENDTIVLRLRENSLEVSASSDYEGTARSEIDAQPLSSVDDDAWVSVGGSWLLEALQVVEEPEVFLAVDKPSAPLVLMVQGWRYIVMPRNI